LHIIVFVIASSIDALTKYHAIIFTMKEPVMMKTRCLSICMTIMSILMLTLSTALTSPKVIAASTSTTPPPKTLTGYIPAAVSSGQAHLVGHHPGTDQLALAIGLPLRNEQALKQFLNEVSTPHNPRYRHYLTLAQENQLFNPTSQQEQQVITWLKSHGLTVTHTYPNHLLVDVSGTFAQIEQVFHITINDYTMQLNGQQITFYAPANEPTLDGSMKNLIDTILGLDDYPTFQVDDAPVVPARLVSNGNVSASSLSRPDGNGKADNSPPYYPQDFASAYHVKPLWNRYDTGTGQHIGITLWGPPPSSAALKDFDAQTGATPPNLQTILVDGGAKYPVSTGVAVEAGMDVEYASGMAPGATIDYYEAPDTKNGNPTDNGLDDALNMAGTDTNNNAQIGDSWAGCEATSISNPFTMKTEQIFQSNTVTGHDYLFASGDNGSACVPNPNKPCSYKNPYPEYPASSDYVTSVGGTTFDGNINGRYPGEVAWNYIPSTCSNGQGNPPEGSGGGYSKLFYQPFWQVAYTTNNYRGYPDVAADADQNTGAYICFDTSNGPTCSINGSPQTYGGGTSLATQLWAGMMADVDQYVSYITTPLGFINPLLYGIPYYTNQGIAYHDIRKGQNGHYKAGPGWDAVTGLGTPNLYNLAQDAAQFLGASGYVLQAVTGISANNVWAVGYSQVPSFFQNLIEQWNGTNWKNIFSPDPGVISDQLSGVAAISANDVWAVGSYASLDSGYQTLIEQWNGQTWSTIRSPNPGVISDQLSGVAAISANDVWAVGSYDDGNGEYTLIEQWDGTNWNIISSPNPNDVYNINLYGVTAVSADDIWAVGDYSDSNGNYYTLIEQWNGTSWNIIPSPNSAYNTILTDVAAVSADDVWAVGDYSDSNGNYYTLIEQWNGTSWNTISSPNPNSYNSNLYSVTAVTATDVWAVGDYEDSNGIAYTLVEQWNGTNWNIVPSPNSAYNTILNGVTAVSATDVWAVGFYYYGPYAPLTLIEQWNGTSWNLVPSPNANAPGKRK
jgi:hypothetical protein